MPKLVLLNPAASQARRNLTQVRATLADASTLSGADVEVCETWEEGRDAAARAAGEGYEMVVAAGGDGTINSVVNGLVSASPPRPVLGILPLGTGNDMARSLGLPPDLEGSLAVLERDRRRKLDAFEVNQDGASRFAANVSAGGFSGEVDEDLKEEDKERWGPIAYLKTAIERVKQVESYDAVLTDGEGRERRMKVCNVVVANGRWAGGGIPVAPEARMEDGLLDVVVLSSAPVARLGVVVARMAAGRHLDHELVTRFRVRELRIVSEPPMRFNVDGELLGLGAAEFRVIPGALRVVVGPETNAI